MISVKIKDEKSQKEYHVFGRFPFNGAWWKVNVKVKQAGSKYYVQGYPSYFLRTHPGEKWKEVISLFLKDCKVPEQFIKAFFEWLPEKASLNFENLVEKLNQFRVSKEEERNDQRDTKGTGGFDIFHYIENSGK